MAIGAMGGYGKYTPTKTDEFSEKFIFMPKKPCLKVQMLQDKFLDWKWPLPASPLRNFSENSSVLEWVHFPEQDGILIEEQRQASRKYMTRLWHLFAGFPTA